MLAKLTTKNQLTLPKAVVQRFSGAEYFEVSALKDRIVLRPVQIGKNNVVRTKLAKLGIRESDIEDAVQWAHTKKK